MPILTADTRSHPETGWRIVRLTAANDDGSQETVATFAPDVGANLYQFSVDGVEYLYDHAEPPVTPTALLGTPVLYPTPNRVRDSAFTFDGQTYRFPPNDGARFLHGLVRHLPWELGTPLIDDQSVTVETHVSFCPGSEHYALYPLRNRLAIRYSLSPGCLRMNFCVENQEEQQRLPFGVAIHPYFRIHGPRESVRITVPASKWMEAVALLPTANLLPMEDGPADISRPTSLADLDLDDVFWGMRSEAPAAIEYDSLGKRVTLAADADFTHAVVYTPQGKPYFCIENQTCSTDAHNLHAAGKTEASHLLILDAGETWQSTIEICVSDL